VRDLNAPAIYRATPAFNLPPAVVYGATAASAMIVARNPETIAAIPTTNDWRVFEAPPGRGWTDDYINMPRALYEGLSGIEECRVYPESPSCGGNNGEAEEAPTPTRVAPASP
jgi:hypothetical protein